MFMWVLAQVQAGVGEMRRLQREKGLQLQSLLNFLRAENCDARLERRIMTWVRPSALQKRGCEGTRGSLTASCVLRFQADFDIGVAQQLEQQRMALSYLLPPMKEKLVSVLHGGRLRKAVDYFDVQNPFDRLRQLCPWMSGTDSGGCVCWAAGRCRRVPRQAA